MKIIRQSTQYKKDFKRYRNQPKKLEKLLGVLRLLANDEELPADKLIGEYNDCMECHIEGDFLLIWYDEEEDIITLLRIGSHSELFK